MSTIFLKRIGPDVMEAKAIFIVNAQLGVSDEPPMIMFDSMPTCIIRLVNHCPKFSLVESNEAIFRLMLWALREWTELASAML
jgi:hypothetical protein